MKLLLNTDGGSRGNPGPAAYGYVIQDITSGLPAGQAGAGIILEKCGKYLGVTTNNQAEYQGLLAGVKWVVDNHPGADLLIKMDSLLIVNQVKGLYKVKSPELFPIFQEVRGLLLKLPNWSIEHTYREGNTLADSLVNEALDAHTN
ncbi:ribonuclease HI family protein [Candidatus Woesebacteria bacterium]|nr:ribonuclease HI family protein [Candidatus Woesebacteria bacterium]